jgi:hypothetical protein
MLRRIGSVVAGVTIAAAVSSAALVGTAAASPPPPHRDLGKHFGTVRQCQDEARREHRALDCRLGPDHRSWHLWG